MPRLPKWILCKEWLTYDDVIKVFETSPSDLENVFSHDGSEEMSHSYRYLCTFAPRECETEYKEYRFESTARQGIRRHLKDHIKTLKVKSAVDKTEFLTRNQMFQKGKSQKNKLTIKSEVAAKVVEPSSKKSRRKASPSLEPQTKKRRFTRIKRVISKENECTKSEEVAEKSVVASPPLPQHAERVVSPDYLSDEKDLVESSDEIQNGELMEVKDEVEDFDKISCETQTEHRGKEVETIQYKIATRLFAVDRSQWNNIKQVLDDIIKAESSSEEITADDKERIIDGMEQWIQSVKIYDQQTVTKLQDPLTPTEEGILNSMTVEDWHKLDVANDPESKLRLTVYARLLLRDYEWYPRKLKPKVCRHCQKHYTASTSLYSHLVSLSGIRFWVCSKCKETSKEEATFTRKHSLQYHILKEVGIPRYRCHEPGCNKTHNHTHHQKSHARQHTGEKHYICEIQGCKGQFSNRNTYSRHLLQFHSTELTRGNQLREIDEKEAQLKVYAARLKARERSKCKRQRFEGGQAEAEPEKQTVEQRALTRLLCNKQNDTSPAVSGVGLGEIEKLMRPSASQLLCGIARDVRNTTSSIEGSGRSSDSMLGGLNLLATVSKYMNAENCEDDVNSFGKADKGQFDKIPRKSNGSYTKLIEALDIGQSALRGSSENYNASDSKSQGVPIISSLDAHVKKPNAENTVLPTKAVSKESATIIAKPSQLLPIPVGQKPISDQNGPKSDAEGPKLPSVIQGLKNRLLNPPKYSIPNHSAVSSNVRSSPLQALNQVVLPTNPKPSPLQVVTSQPVQKAATGKIIVNLSQMQPVCTSASLVEIDKRRKNISTLSTTFNPVSKEETVVQARVAPIVSTTVNRGNTTKTLQFRTLTGLSGKTYIVLPTVNNVTECYPVPSDTTDAQSPEKTVPFSQL